MNSFVSRLLQTSFLALTISSLMNVMLGDAGQVSDTKNLGNLLQ